MKTKVDPNGAYVFKEIILYLKVLIPFMNENEEVIATVADVWRTVGRHVDILVVNDGSTDGYNYPKSVIRS